MVNSTEDEAMKVAENVVVDETSTKEEAKTDIVTEDTTTVTEAASTTETASTTEVAPTTEEVSATEPSPVKDTEEKSATKKKAEKKVSNENAEAEQEPYFGETGNIDNLKVTLGNSDLYTKEELQSAVDYILGKFQVDFTDCVMTELNYDEAFSVSQSKVWADQYNADEAIVFTCTFNTTENYQELVMEPGQVCEGYNWILTRNEGEDWTLQTWGY